MNRFPFIPPGLAAVAISLLVVGCREQAPTGLDQPAPIFDIQEGAEPPFSEGPQGTTGDNPLATSFTFTGNVGLAIDVVPFSFSPVPSTFVISGLPGGSTVLQALMYVQRWTGRS